MEILSYKNYDGTAEFDAEFQCWHGKLRFIDDLVTYKANSPETLQYEFEAAVDDYLDTCRSLEREPEMPSRARYIG